MTSLEHDRTQVPSKLQNSSTTHICSVALFIHARMLLDLMQLFDATEANFAVCTLATITAPFSYVRPLNTSEKERGSAGLCIFRGRDICKRHL